MNKIILSYSYIHQSIFDAVDDDEVIIGFLPLKKDILEVLEVLKESNITTGVYEIFSNDRKISEYDLEDKNDYGDLFDRNYKIKIDLNKMYVSGNIVICKDWKSLLSYEDKIINPADEVYFTDYKSAFNAETSDDIFLRYLKVGEVYKLIESLSMDEVHNDLVVFYERPIKLKIKLNVDDLSSDLDFGAVENLNSLDLHREALLSLMRKEVVVFLKDISESERFGYLVRHINSLVSNVLISYQSYVQDYSFDKVRKEYQERFSEYVEKINNSFDSVLLKMFSIPAGIWFATMQIDVGGVDSYQFSKNIVVLITIFILSSMMALNISGGLSTLKSLEDEYTGLFGRLSEAFDGDRDEILKLSEELKSKNTIVSLKLYTSLFFSLVLFFLTLFLVIKAYI